MARMRALGAAADRPDPAAGENRVSFELVSEPGRLGPLWLDLQERAECSFFQSWGWIGCWLRRLPSDCAPRALIVSQGARPTCIGILVAHERSLGPVPWLKSLHLHETGRRALDTLTVEHNGFLADRSDPPAAQRAALRWLVQHEAGWDELHLSGLSPPAAGAAPGLAAELGLGLRARALQPRYWVDLDQLRRAGGDYLATLTANARQQIRRSLRLYERGGALRVETARTLDQAHAFLDGLRELHQDYWEGRGQPGSFANRFFADFHAELIGQRHGAGEIQLLRIAAGGNLIGYLYNFVWNGAVYAYQSGFAYGSDPKIKAGMVCHCMAIEQNLAAGARTYDFLAGDARYKRSLATHSEPMAWLVLQRRSARLRGVSAARALKGALTRLSRRA